jgi:DNA polymerase III delta prime subunit
MTKEIALTSITPHKKKPNAEGDGLFDGLPIPDFVKKLAINKLKKKMKTENTRSIVLNFDIDMTDDDEDILNAFSVEQFPQDILKGIAAGQKEIMKLLAEIAEKDKTIGRLNRQVNQLEAYREQVLKTHK